MTDGTRHPAGAAGAAGAAIQRAPQVQLVPLVPLVHTSGAHVRAHTSGARTFLGLSLGHL